MAVNSTRAIKLAANDDVAATLAPVEPRTSVAVIFSSSGETTQEFAAQQPIPFGHKVAIHDIPRGKPINRYGYPIGVATADIKQGEHVHSHNMRSLLSPVPASDAESRDVRPEAWIRKIATDILQASGVRPEAAEAMADALTEAHLRGVETHGLRRLRPYVMRIRSGAVDGRARPSIERRQAMLAVDGRNAVGHYVGAHTARAVTDAARELGVAVALVRNSNHFGFAGYYATLIAAAGQIGIVISNGQVCVGPQGAPKALLSNNPFAIAAPTGRSDAFLELDLATSMTSRANVVEAAKSGALLPAGWAQNSEGHATRDPAAALLGSLLAFGGGKGFGLLFALEAMTGVLSGGAYADQVSSKEAAPNTPEKVAHTLIAIDLDRAIGRQAYVERLDDLIARLRALPNEEPKSVRYPGERRWELRRARLRDGIPLSPSELADLLNLADELGVKAA